MCPFCNASFTNVNLTHICYYITICIVFIAFALFPNIFCFLIGILPVFVILRSPLRLHYQVSQSAR